MEENFLDQARENLNSLLSEIAVQVVIYGDANASPGSSVDAAWVLQGDGAHAQLLVQARRRLSPADVSQIVAMRDSALRHALRNWTLLVVAPWLSPRTRHALDKEGISYLDLTGNVALRIASNPLLLVRIAGAERDPNRKRKPLPALQGVAVGELLRLLVDTAPPYRVTDLAAATSLSVGYVSRAITALADEGLIARTGRLISDVDWVGILRLRAQGYDLLRSNQAMTFVAQRGIGAVYAALSQASTPTAVVTGSFAAHQYVKIAQPRQLAIYAAALGNYADELSLLPTEDRADVLLLRPASFAQLNGARRQHDGTVHAAVSQVALDCLAGNGRLPQEGEALIEWMSGREVAWRRRHLDAT